MDEISARNGKDNDLRVASPAGGSYFEYDDVSSSSSPTSSTSTNKLEDSASPSSFVTAKDSSSRTSLQINSATYENSSDSDQIEDSNIGGSFSEDNKEDDLETQKLNISDGPSFSSASTHSTPSSPTIKVESEAMTRSLPKPEEGSQIIQTKEALISKGEIDRAKRFDYLLKQTEIWGHFMQPAYVEALSFSQESLQKSTSSKTEIDSPQVSSKKKRKVPRMPMPDVGAASGLKAYSKSVTQYVTHFDVSPTYIEGGSMRDYQVRGLNWMISLYEKGLSGILADEMGLGKTIQAISLLGYMKHYREIDGPHLIIAPKSTLPNWMNELKKWCPTLKAICLIGSKEERPSLIKNKFLPKRWNVCVTSYEMAKIERTTLAKVNYHYIIIDEAQKIKNENSLLSTCVRSFKSSVRLLMTVTPLQNNLHELWALLNFLLPDVFSSSEDFDSWYNESNCMGNQMVDRLHAVLRPFLLRRIKSDVEKSLPPKKEMRIYVQMSEMQREWYKKILLDDIEIINNVTGRATKKALHNTIMHLRKVCNHPYLFEGAEPKPFTTDTHLITNCGKMIVLDKLLQKLKAQQSRVLLFSQMTRMLDILEDYCIWRGFGYCRLDGSTDYDVRQEDIDEFNAPNSSKFIYLLSTRAGGLGINLASANIVIIYDSDWNPMMDLQAMDRAHRIGQTKEVKVFRFVVQDTAEEKIVERAAAKLHLDKVVIQQGRLVGADGVKAPSSVEMMSVARFGAEKILKSGKNEGISDADVDTILAQSKLRSEELDRRLNGMSEDNLKELTVEHVEWSYEQKPVVENYTYLFEGQNYRELRKRKKVQQDWTEQVRLEGKRRKDNLSGIVSSINDDDGAGSLLCDDSDISSAVSDNESTASRYEESLQKKLIRSILQDVKKPLQDPSHKNISVKQESNNVSTPKSKKVKVPKMKLEVAEQSTEDVLLEI